MLVPAWGPRHRVSSHAALRLLLLLLPCLRKEVQQHTLHELQLASGTRCNGSRCTCWRVARVCVSV